MRTSKAKRTSKRPARNWDWKSLSQLEKLIACVAVLGLFVLGCLAVEGWISPLITQDEATKFAVELRDIAARARDQNSQVTVDVIPAAPGRKSAYGVYMHDELLYRKEFPMGISATGKIVFDQQGVPTVPTTVIFNRGKSRAKINVGEAGIVSMPLSGT